MQKWFGVWLFMVTFQSMNAMESTAPLIEPEHERWLAGQINELYLLAQEGKESKSGDELACRIHIALEAMFQKIPSPDELDGSASDTLKQDLDDITMERLYHQYDKMHAHAFDAMQLIKSLRRQAEKKRWNSPKAGWLRYGGVDIY